MQPKSITGFVHSIIYQGFISGTYLTLIWKRLKPLGIPLKMWVN